VEAVVDHRLDGATPAQDLQEHHAVAVHVALLRDVARVAVF
jgi:hypothetical protein